MKRVLTVGLLMLGFVGCGKDSGTSDSPTGPSTQTQTRTIRLEAILEFGDVAVGRTAERILRIYNEGNAALTVSGLTAPAGGAYTATWTDGTIAPGTSQGITVRFSPTEARTYNGTLTVNANQTGGTTTTPISGRGVSVTPPPTPTPSPAPTPTPTPTPTPPPSTCCKVCTTGKACGDTCISKEFTCRTAPGCACNGLVGAAFPELTYTPVPSPSDAISTTYSSTEAIRRTR